MPSVCAQASLRRGNRHVTSLPGAPAAIDGLGTSPCHRPHRASPSLHLTTPRRRLATHKRRALFDRRPGLSRASLPPGWSHGVPIAEMTLSPIGQTRWVNRRGCVRASTARKPSPRSIDLLPLATPGCARWPGARRSRQAGRGWPMGTAVVDGKTESWGDIQDGHNPSI